MRLHSFAALCLAFVSTIAPLASTVAPPDGPAPPSPCPTFVELSAVLRRSGLTAQAAKNAAIMIREDCRQSPASA